MGCGYNDIYVLAPVRSAEAAFRFLDQFTPHREQASEDYQFPEGATNPLVVFRDAADAIRYAAVNPEETQRLYFRNSASESPAHAMLFFTSDGGMVVGVSVGSREDRYREAAEVADWLTRLRAATGATTGFALYESPPSCQTIDEFLADFAFARPPKLVNGQIILLGPGEEPGVVFLR